MKVACGHRNQNRQYLEGYAYIIQPSQGANLPYKTTSVVKRDPGSVPFCQYRGVGYEQYLMS
jgi:hypothetical protein